MINFLNRHRAEIQSRMSKNVILKYTPRLYFKFDDSIESGDRVLGILAHLDIPEDEVAPPLENDETVDSTEESDI